MHEFRFVHNKLYCESVSVKELALRYGTPLYIYSKKTLLDHYHKIEDAFKSIKPLICYSMKANSNLEICRILVKEGAGLDIVSGGELYKALKTGLSGSKIVYAGVGKTEDEIKFGIKNNIFLFNVESLPELMVIDRVASAFKKRQSVAIRINPDIKPKTHRYIVTGRHENKFGVDFDTAREIFLNRSRYQNLDISGIHMHIGSQIVDARPFVRAINRMIQFVEMLGSKGIHIKWFDIGGGLGIIYSNEKPQTAKEYASAILPLLKRLKAKVILEPGRFIVGNSGILVTRVLYIKNTERKNFAIIDAGMNDLIRPSLYDAYHEILPVESVPYTTKEGISTYDVVGPICESGDFMGRDRKFIGLKEGSFLAIMGAGAYGFSMASNYNLRPRPAEVLVYGKAHRLIRRREGFSDLLRCEKGL